MKSKHKGVSEPTGESPKKKKVRESGEGSTSTVVTSRIAQASRKKRSETDQAEKEISKKIRLVIWRYKESRYQLSTPGYETTVRTLQEMTLPKADLKPVANLLCRIAILIPKAAYQIERVAEKDKLEFEHQLDQKLRRCLPKDITEKLGDLAKSERPSEGFSTDQLVEIYTLRVAQMYGLVTQFDTPQGFFREVSELTSSGDNGNSKLYVSETLILVEAVTRCHENLLQSLPKTNVTHKTAAQRKRSESRGSRQSVQSPERSGEDTGERSITEEIHISVEGVREGANVLSAEQGHVTSYRSSQESYADESEHSDGA